MAARVRKAVFPVAGLGTRFLPATKAMPKEMLTVVDRPLIQHVVDEAMEAGIEHFIFITGRNKGVIEDHFDRQFELEQVLAARGKTSELREPQRRSAGPWQHELHPPAGAARLGPRRVVRARTRRPRAVRAAPSRRAGADTRQRMPRPDARRLCEARRQHRRGRARARRPGEELRRGQRRRRRRTRVSHRRHGGEASSLAPRPRTSPFSAAISSSPRSSTCSRRRSRAPAAKSRSPMPCSRCSRVSPSTR